MVLMTAPSPQLRFRTGAAGRPKMLVNIDTVEFFRSCGYTWNQVAHALQVSRSTLWRRLRDVGYQMTKYSDISDDELDSIVAPLSHRNPHIIGKPQLGFSLWLRESVARIDPIRRMIRWQQVVDAATMQNGAIASGTLMVIIALSDGVWWCMVASTDTHEW